MLESELIMESETLKKIITTYAKVFSVYRLPFVVSIMSIYVILYSKFLNKMRQQHTEDTKISLQQLITLTINLISAQLENLKDLTFFTAICTRSCQSIFSVR